MKMIDGGKAKEYIESHRDMFGGDWNFIVDFFGEVPDKGYCHEGEI